MTKLHQASMDASVTARRRPQESQSGNGRQRLQPLQIGTSGTCRINRSASAAMSVQGTPAANYIEYHCNTVCIHHLEKVYTCNCIH